LGIIDKIKGRNKEAIEFQRAERLSVHANENQNPGTEEYTELTNRAGFLITDENVLNLFMANKCLNSLVPIASPTNSVIKLSRYEADLKRVRIDNHICLLKLTMDPKVYNANGLEILEGSRLFLHDRVSGADEGWIGHIATETTRRHVFAEEKKRN
jgi:hypothetical protein